MDILYGFKGWYTLSEAAERLSRTLRQNFSVSDIIQIASDGHLVLSWYLTGEHRAVNCTVTCPYPRESETFFQIHEEVDSDGNAWLTSIFGAFRLPVDLYPPWRRWLLTFVGKGCESGTGWDPIVISVEDGTYWALSGEGDGGDFMHFPKLDQLVISRADIEGFEQRCLVPSAPLVDPSMGAKAEAEREKLLKQIAGLALLLSSRSTGSSRYISGTKPNASSIAADVSDLIGEIPDKSHFGTGNSSIRASISEGIKLLQR